MAVKYYKLVGYKPFWIYADGKYPRSHIEDILKTTSSNNIRFLLGMKKLTDSMSNDEHWVPTENYEWHNIWKVTATGKEEDIADYIKVVIGNHTYYYYLINKTENIRATEGDVPYFDAEYEFDEYMTVFWDKLEILRHNNPRVLVKFGFNNRWDQRIDENGNLVGYVIDYISQRWISNSMADTNDMMVREFVYDTTATDIYSLNFPNTVIPQTYSVNRYNTGADAITLTDFINKLNTPNSRGRYEYIVAKSSSKMKSNNDELVNAHTDDKFILIPLFADMRAQILHGLNDFDITAEYDGFLVPFGDNEMGIWECDIPFSIFWGYVANNQYGGAMQYAHQKMENDQYIDIPFFSFDNNAPILLKIIDYATYNQGFYGKFLYMINNIYLWTPETEPAMIAPNFYQEVYNNGEAELTIDAAKFVFKWNSESIDRFGVEAYLSLSSDLVIAYNFGTNTNSKLATLDNTETVLGKGSIKNMYIGSNSATYFTSNASTTSTSLQNRQSEEEQAWTDFALNSAKQALDIMPNNIGQALNPFRYVKKAAMATLNVTQTMVDTTYEQDRANREFRASLNNIRTAPSQTLSDPSVKATIPNKRGLFEAWAKKLHPDMVVTRFNSYIHNGYPIDAMMYLNDVLNNRQFMNVINLDTTKNEDDLMKILTEQDTTIFNTKFWNKRFLAWMNSASNIYNSDRLINCTDYTGAQYVSNIETELPDVPVPKDDIARFIKNFRTAYEANYDFILYALMEDNPDAPEDIWEQISIKDMEFGGFRIEALTDPDSAYYGNILVQTICYNGYIEETVVTLKHEVESIEQKKEPVRFAKAQARYTLASQLNETIKHYFWNVDFLCNTNYRTSASAKISWNITCPDGTMFSNETFNGKIVWIEEIEDTTIINIPNGFLNACYSFQEDLIIPNYINSIGEAFMYDCGIDYNGDYQVGDFTVYYLDANGELSSSTYDEALVAKCKINNVAINCSADKFANSDKSFSVYANIKKNSVYLDDTYGTFTIYNEFTKKISGDFASEIKNKFSNISYTPKWRGFLIEHDIYYDSALTNQVFAFARKLG